MRQREKAAPRVNKIACVAGLAGLSLILASCSGAQTAAGDAEAADIPEYYGSEYQELIDAAQQESGSLTIYSSTSQPNWTPIFEAFQEQYPFVTDVKNLDLEGEQIYQRAMSEISAGTGEADLIGIQPTTGALFAEEDGIFLDYTSPEIEELPEGLARPLGNIYQWAIVPQVIGVNTHVVDEEVTTIKELADLVDEGGADVTVGVRDVSSSFAFSTYYRLLEEHPELWEEFEKILPHAKPESSTGALLTKLTSGEYGAAVFVDAAQAAPTANQSGGLLEIIAPEDGTTFQARGIAISSVSENPNTAKLFLDFLLSEKGQQAVLEAGLSAYRDDLAPVEGVLSFDEATTNLPDSSIVSVEYEDTPTEEVEEFTERWNALLGG